MKRFILLLINGVQVIVEEKSFADVTDKYESTNDIRSITLLDDDIEC